MCESYMYILTHKGNAPTKINYACLDETDDANCKL